MQPMQEPLAGGAGGDRFMVLDSLRGVAALMVVLFHAQIANHVNELAVVRAGEMFVDFFFVLSGFVIAHAYRRRIVGPRAAGRFLVLRAGRILPLHVAVLSVFVAFELIKVVVPELGLAGDEPFSGSNAPWTILTNLALLHSVGLHDTLTWNAPSWSISGEAVAYLAFALAVPLMAGRLWIGAAATVLASLAVLVTIAPFGMESTHDFGAVRALYGFASGVLVHHLAIEAIQRGRARLSTGRLRHSLCWTAVELFAVALAVGFVVAAYKTAATFAAPLVFAVAVCVFAHEGGYVSRLLRQPPLVLIGTLSFSIYMVHLLILMRVTNVARLAGRLTGTSVVTTVSEGTAGIDLGNPYAGDALLLAVLLVTVGASYLTYRFIEQPGREWFRRLAAQIFDQPDVAASQPV